MNLAVAVLVAAVSAAIAAAISLLALAVAFYKATPAPRILTEEGKQPAFVGPVARLSFTESLDPELFSGAAKTAAIESLKTHWQGVLGDGATVSLNGLRLLSSNAEMVVSISAKGGKLITRGLVSIPRHATSGRLLPIVTDQKTGRIIEVMKEARAAKRLTQLTALSSVVVGAAHLIASADIARKLRVIDGKLDALLAYRWIDQFSALERIYTSAKELACGPLNDAKRFEIWRLRGELRQLRSAWRREMQFQLSKIDKPTNAGWLERQLKPIADIRDHAKDRLVHGKISEGQLHLSLIEYAMRLDQVLAIGGGTLPEFEQTLADELTEMTAVAELLATKAGYLTGKSENLSVEPILSGIRGMIEYYTAILPDGTSRRRAEPGPVLSLPQQEQVINA